MDAQLLRTIRTGMGVTQGQLANAIGVSRKTINEMELGKSRVDTRTELAVLYLDEHRERLAGPGAAG